MWNKYPAVEQRKAQTADEIAGRGFLFFYVYFSELSVMNDFIVMFFFCFLLKIFIQCV
jgi:hypothetical protein